MSYPNDFGVYQLWAMTKWNKLGISMEKEAWKLFSGRTHQLLNAAIGLAGEAGEVADEVKKLVFHGHAYDRNKMVEELGDVLYYLSVLADRLEINLDDVVRANELKLMRRYPDGFTTEKSNNRD